MSRKYVIMKDTELEGEWDSTPYDVVSSLERAEEICRVEEQKSLDNGEYAVYYWCEVISSED